MRTTPERIADARAKHAGEVGNGGEWVCLRWVPASAQVWASVEEMAGLMVMR